MTATYVHCRCCGNILSTGVVENFEHDDPEEFADREIIDPRTGEPRIVQVVTKYVKRTKAQPSGFTFEGVICQPTKDGPVSFCVDCYGEHQVHKMFPTHESTQTVGHSALPPEAPKESEEEFRERLIDRAAAGFRAAGLGDDDIPAAAEKAAKNLLKAAGLRHLANADEAGA